MDLIDDAITPRAAHRWLLRMYRSSDVPDPSHISPMVRGREHTAAIVQQRGPTVGGLPSNDGASLYRCILMCVDEQIFIPPTSVWTRGLYTFI